MDRETFSRREVDRAFRRFADCVRDMSNSAWQTWNDHLRHLIEHCETDPVMRVVTEPLRTNTNVNATEWVKAAKASVRGMMGSGNYVLPTNLDDQAALLYQLLQLVRDGKLDILHFCLPIFGTTNMQECINTFNTQLVNKFTREVSYRLEEINQDIGQSQAISKDMLCVFHYHIKEDHSVNIHGNVQGSNIAGPGATITGSTATYNNNTELADVLKSLKPLIGEIAAEQRQAVEAALNAMIDATEKNIPVAQAADVQPAVAVVAAASPTLGQRLKDIAGRLGVSLASSAIVQAIKTWAGIH